MYLILKWVINNGRIGMSKLLFFTGAVRQVLAEE